MIIKNLVLAGALAASLGTGTAVYASTNHQASAHNVSHTQNKAGAIHKKHVWLKRSFIKEAAKTLKMNEKTLLGKLKSGESLSEVAKAEGISVATLKANMEKPIEAKLAKAVKAGKMPRAKEQAILSKVDQNLGRLIDHKGLPKRGGHWLKRSFIKEAAKKLKVNKKTLLGKLKSGESLSEVAKAEGISVATLKANMEKPIEAKLAKAVKAGKMPRAKEQAILSRVDQNLGRLIDHKGLPKRGGHSLKRSFIKEAAKTLKMNEKTLLGKLKSGESLADIAKEQGVSVSTLKDNMLAVLKSKLDRAGKAGKLESSKEQRMLSKWSNRLEKLIDHKEGAHGNNQ